jgi:glycine cleavage system aminomethyltransferase T
MTDFDATALVRDYGDGLAEARACRADCALFDFSFISRARIGGSGAIEALARLQPRPMGDIMPGRIRYAVRLGAMSVIKTFGTPEPVSYRRIWLISV